MRRQEPLLKGFVVSRAPARAVQNVRLESSEDIVVLPGRLVVFLRRRGGHRSPAVLIIESRSPRLECDGNGRVKPAKLHALAERFFCSTRAHAPLTGLATVRRGAELPLTITVDQRGQASVAAGGSTTVELDDLSEASVSFTWSAGARHPGPMTVTIWPGIRDRDLYRDARVTHRMALRASDLWRQMPKAIQDVSWSAATNAETALGESKWTLAASLDAAERAARDLLSFPVPREEVDGAWPLTASFFDKPSRDLNANRARELVAHGWDFDALAGSRARGREWAHQVVCHEQIREAVEGAGDLAVFAAALTAREWLINSRADPPPAGLARTLTLIDSWIARNISASPTRFPYRPPRANHEHRRRLAALIHAAPWVAFRLGSNPDYLKPRLTVDQMIEAATVARPGFEIVSAQRATGGHSLVPRSGIGAAQAVLVVDDVPIATIGALIEAASLIVGSPGDAFERLAEMPVEMRQRFEAATQFAARLYDAPITALRVVVDPVVGQAVAINTDPSTGMRVTIGTEQGFELAPCTTTHSESWRYASPMFPFNDEIIVASVGDEQVRLEVPERPGIDLDSAASNVTIALPMFRGRTRELAAINHAAIDAAPHARKPVVIFGNRRAGKTTLAHRALRAAADKGTICARLTIDVVDGVGADGTTGADLSARLASKLTRALRRELKKQDVELPDLGSEIDDFVDLLVELDEAWDPAVPPLGLLLDELDSLFYDREDGPVYALAARLGNIGLRNIALLGTVQRHGHEANVLKEWHAVSCPATLTWKDAVEYFCGFLVEESKNPTVVVPYRPVVPPGLLNSQVVARLGLRPYFWGQLFTRLESEASVSGQSLMDEDPIRRAIDEIVENDTMLALFDQRETGLPVREARRQDVFSDIELALLAEFACATADHVDLHRVKKVLGVDAERAIGGLTEREMLTRQGTNLVLAPPIFLERLRARQTMFAPLLRGSATPLADAPRPERDGPDAGDQTCAMTSAQA